MEKSVYNKCMYACACVCVEWQNCRSLKFSFVNWKWELNVWNSDLNCGFLFIYAVKRRPSISSYNCKINVTNVYLCARENNPLNRLHSFHFFLFINFIIEIMQKLGRLDIIIVLGYLLYCAQLIQCHRSDVYIAGFFPYGVGKENSETGE